MNIQKIVFLLLVVLNMQLSSVFAQDQTKIDSLKLVIADIEKKCPQLCIEDTSRISAYIEWADQIYMQYPDSSLKLDFVANNIAEDFLKTFPPSHPSTQVIKKLQLVALNSIGYIYQNQGDIPKAIEYYKKSLNISEEIEYKEGEASFYNNIGYIYQTQGDIPKAIEYYNKSLNILEKIGNKEGMATSYNNIGIIYYNQGDIPKSLEYFNKSLKIEEEIGNKEGMARSYNNFGIIYYNQGDIPKSLEYYNKSLNIQEEIGNKEGIAYSYNNIGVAYELLGETLKSLEYYNKSLNIHEEIGNKEGMAHSYNNIGMIYKMQGDIPKSLEYFNKSLNIFEEIETKLGMAKSYNSIGLIYDMQGDIPKALKYYNKSLNIFEEIGNKAGIALSYNNIGYIYKDQGDFPKALEYYNKSLNIREEIRDKKAMANSYTNIGIIYYNQGDVPKALEYYNKSLNIQEEIRDKKGMAKSYNNIGLIYNMQGDFPKALEYYNKSLNISKERDDKPGKVSSYGNIGSIYQRQYNLALFEKYSTKAYKLSKELGFPKEIKSSASLMKELNITKKEYIKADTFAIEEIDITNKAILSNFASLSEKGQEKYLKIVAVNYMDFNSFALMRKQDNPKIINYVFNNTLKNKGLLLKSSTAMRFAVLNSNDTVLITNYYKWIHLKKKIVKYYSKGKNAKELEEQANVLEKELVKNSQFFSDFKKLQNIKWQDIQNSLKPNELAIEFIHFRFKDYTHTNFSEFTDSVLYCALIVTPKSKQPEMIPLFEEKQLEKIIGKFGGNNYSYIYSIYGKNDEVNTELFNLIWKPMEASLKGAKKVYLSPDGLLHKISFSAIAKEQNVYLCDAYDIEVKSTTGKIIDSQSATQSRALTNATLFGGINYNTDSTKQEVWSYLEGTKTETQEINKILKKRKVNVNYYTNKSATEEEFKQMASNSNILHIATHGFFYPDPKEVQEEIEKKVEYGDIAFRGGSRGFGVNSFVENNNPLMRSGLVFAGANDVWRKQAKNDTIDDGVLTAQEVSNIDMRKTNLVVMSACETGLGDIKGSEGVYGLQRAFKMAGVDFIIMSLWQVPDKETKEFMVSFYKKLIKQKDIKKAFAETQKEMRTKYDPYFWAAFILIE